MKLKLAAPILIIFFSSHGFSQNTKKISSNKSVNAVSPLKRADEISVKAALEDMIVRRYSQELSALITFERFNVGARFELETMDESKDKNRKLSSQNDQYTDLDLGYLDADTLFDRYQSVDAASVSPLAKYAVKSVMVNVGLQERMGNKIKSNIEEWLQARVKEEFGALGKSQVQFIQSETTNPSTLDRIIQMQGLVGQLILALAILLGVVLWRLLSGGKSKDQAQAASVNIESKSEMTATEGLGGSSPSKESNLAAIDLALDTKIEAVSDQIKDLSPKLVTQLDQLVAQWCEQGETGLMQIACFAEISGSVLGSLPIPKEHKKEMGNVFSKMSELPLEKRLDVTNRTYWDLVASLNLGTDTLHRPFSFLGSSSLGTVNQVLLGNDIDIQTVVSLYMPESLRKNYFSKLADDKKVELLNTAAKLSSISQDKLNDIETQIAPYFEEKVAESEVSMSMTLNKLVESMSYIDACKILPKVEGPVVETFKQKNPHIGFFADWKKESQEVVIKRSTNEELMAYLRIVPNMTDTILGLISPRAKQILEDDLSRSDLVAVVEKERLIYSLHNRLENLVLTNVISLEDAIKKKDDNAKGLSVAA